MTQERITKLRSINFSFPGLMEQMTYKQRWNHWFKELQKYYEEHEDSNVPVNYLANPQLGTWVYRQRKHYKNFMYLKQLEYDKSTSDGQDKSTPKSKSNTTGMGIEKKPSSCPMTQEMIDNLHTVAFIFPETNNDHHIMAAKQILTHEQKWNARFEELKTYFEENGHSDIPVDYKVNKPLGSWAYVQRTQGFFGIGTIGKR